MVGTRNHPAFRSLGSHYYKYLAGIRPDPRQPGFGHVPIKPQLDVRLSYARASYDSVRGRIVSGWRRCGSSLAVEVTVLANSTASVSVPKDGSGRPTVREGGTIVWIDGTYLPGVPGITGASEDGGYIVFEVGSGSYPFAVG